MNRDELVQRLQGFEWNDTEFKKGQRGVPEAAYETVAAFCNTAALLADAGTRKSSHSPIAPHLKSRLTIQTAGATRSSETKHLVTDQAAPLGQEAGTLQITTLQELTDVQWKVVLFCEAPRTLTEIMSHVGVTSRQFFRRKHLEPLLHGGVLQVKYPDRPSHPQQAYFLTEAGGRLKANRLAQEKARPAS